MEITAEAKKRLAALVDEREEALAPLAAKIGVSQSTLWNFLYGGTKNFSKIHRLATELKVSLDWVLNGDAPRARAGAGRGVLSEPEGTAFGTATGDRSLLREVAILSAKLARDYPALSDEIIGAIAVKIGGDFLSGKLPMPGGRNKAAAKAIAAEMQRLAGYEIGKLG